MGRFFFGGFGSIGFRRLHLPGNCIRVKPSIGILKSSEPQECFGLQQLSLNTTLQQKPLTMPKSKRAKVVHMSKTTKKGKELTIKLHANVQECIPKYPYIYVFSVRNMRNTYLKDVRTQLSDSRYSLSLSLSLSLSHIPLILFPPQKTAD